MNAKICWLCDTNFVFEGYEGKKLLDDEGNKPCLECIQESPEDEEEVK